MQPTEQPNQQNPYGFIMNPEKPPKRPLFGGSMKSRILVVVAGVVLLMILGMVASALLSAGNKAVVNSLKDVIAKQQELIRVSDMGTKNASTSKAISFARTVNLTIKTDQAVIIDYLGRNKGSITDFEKNSAKNSNTDTILEASKANNRYDEVLTEELTKLLTSYRASLNTAYDTAKGENTKATLSKSYETAGTLLGEPAAE